MTVPPPWRDPSREARYGFWMGVTWTVPAVVVACTVSVLIAAYLALVALLGYLAYAVMRHRSR